MYVQLSNQKRLQELRVGPAPLISEGTFPLFQFYTLEMNLDGGLGLLDELRETREGGHALQEPRRLCVGLKLDGRQLVSADLI